MEHNTRKKIKSAAMFLLGTVLSWGGMLYATNDPNQFRVIGILVALLGYGVFFLGALIYEEDQEDKKPEDCSEQVTKVANISDNTISFGSET